LDLTSKLCFMFDVRRLQALHAVAGHGSLGGAAKFLHLTPSAVSQQLAALEREAGCALLSRKGRGVELTEAGRLLAVHAETVLDQLVAARADLDRLQGGAHGVVRVAAFPTVITALVAPTLAVLASALPDVDVRLTEVEPDEAIRLLTAGAIDMALIHSYDLVARSLPPRASVTQLLDDPMLVALPAGHRAARADVVKLTSLRRDRWITPGTASWCFEHVQRACGAAGFVPDIVAHCTEYSTTLTLVQAGAGVALVPELALAGRLPDGVVIRPTSPSRDRHLQLIGPAALSTAADAVAEQLRLAANDLNGGRSSPRRRRSPR
jgi:DNA-binding transcriptional LysR family regulator